MPPVVTDRVTCSVGLSVRIAEPYKWPNLSGCRQDVYHTSTHGVALVWI